MISRVAEACYWLHRYVERLEDTARFLDVNRTFVLDAQLPTAESWRPLIVVAGEEANFIELHGEAGFAGVLDAQPINPATDGPEGAFALVPVADEIIGLPVSELIVGRPIDETGVIEKRFADLSWDGVQRAPFYVSGSIPRPPLEPIAVALNGTIVAVAPTSVRP